MTLVIPPGFGNAAYTFGADFGTPPFIVTCAHDISAYAGDWVAAANSLMSGFASAWAAVLDNGLILDRVTLAVGADGPGGSVDSTATAVPMTRSGTTGAIAESAILRKSTNDLGRRGRGRMFLPGALTSAEIDESGNIGAPRIAQINAAAAAWKTSLETGTPLPPVLLHSSAPTDPTPIESFACSTQVGWVRGRIR